jgi:hypothetical protein
LFSPGTRPNGDPYGNFVNTLTVTLPVTSALETAAPITGTVSLATPAGPGGLLVDLSTDGWRLVGDLTTGITFEPKEINLPQTQVLIGEGLTSATFIVEPYNDRILDGDRMVRIVAAADDDVLPGLVTLMIVDVEPNPYQFVVNELLGDLVGTGLDPNLNEVLEERLEDQFIEILNLGQDPVDVSGWSVHAYPRQGVVSSTLAHVFPAGTIMAGRSAMVLLGGGATIAQPDPDNPENSINVPNAQLVPANFGGAYVQTARLANGAPNPNGLSIPANAPETIVEIRNEHGFVINRLELTSGQTNQGTSITLAPDGTGVPSLHFGVSSTFEMMSPGLTINNTPFAGSNAAYFWLNRAFPGLSLDHGGFLSAVPYGMIYNSAYPYVYVVDARAFWFMPTVDSGTLYAYDMRLGEWVATSQTLFPHAYVMRTGQWVNYR